MFASSNNAPRRQIPVADLQKGFNDQVATLDPQRAQSLTDLTTVRTAKASTLAHEQKLAGLKYGAASPRATVLEQKQAQNARWQTVLAVETLRAQTPAPTVTAESYVFHGFVRDGGQKPVPGVTVALYDASGQWQREYGYGCTDATGYFLIRLDRGATGQKAGTPGRTSSSPGTAQSSPPPAQAPTSPMSKYNPPTAEEASAAAPAVLPALAVLVFDHSQKLLHRESTPGQPKLGRVDYRVIVLDGEGTCTPPPDQTQPGSVDEKPLVPTSLREIASLRKPGATVSTPGKAPSNPTPPATPAPATPASAATAQPTETKPPPKKAKSSRAKKK